MTRAKHIVCIMTDTQRRDMVGCYGNPAVGTPCLDALAAGGLRMERAYTCQPVCGPARSAIFTGTYPHSNGSWANSMALGDNVKTLGQRLGDHGYHTAYIGKWHLDGGDYFGLGRCPDGWDPAYWYDMRNYLEELTPAQRLLSRRAEGGPMPDVPASFTFGHRCADRALDFLKSHGGEDFFLTVSFDEPHGPFLCPAPYRDMFLDYDFPKDPNVWDTLSDKPAHHRAWAGETLNEDKDALRIRRADYLGCNAFVDSEIGRVLDAVNRYAPDALVLYTSDHGDALRSHSLDNKGPALYDEICRIPLLIRWPGVVAPGGVAEHPVSHIDLMPTVLEAAGIPIPKLLEGRSLLPVLLDPAVGVNDEVFIEFGRYETDHDGFGGFQPLRAVFDGRYKLAVNLLATDELYDLQADPSEMVNLIASPAHAAVRDSLHDRLLDWMNRTRDPFRGYWWERRPWRADARPATWDYTAMTRQRENEEYEPRQLDYRTGLPMTEAVRPK